MWRFHCPWYDKNYNRVTQNVLVFRGLLSQYHNVFVLKITALETINWFNLTQNSLRGVAHSITILWQINMSTILYYIVISLESRHHACIIKLIQNNATNFRDPRTSQLGF